MSQWGIGVFAFLICVYALEAFVIPDRFGGKDPIHAVVGWMIVLAPYCIVIASIEIFVRVNEWLKRTKSRP